MDRAKISLCLAVVCTISGPAVAGGSMSMNPLNTSMQFSPHAPEVVAASHPLSARVIVEPIVNVPAKIGTFMNAFARAEDLNDALNDGMASAGMRSTSTARGIFRFTATWVSFDSPFKIGASSRASVTIRYELRRIDSGAVILQREITTSTSSSGGNAADRQRGTARAAIAANFAGAIWCLEQAAYGKAPENCAVSPVGSFSAPIIVPLFR